MQDMSFDADRKLKKRVQLALFLVPVVLISACDRLSVQKSMAGSEYTMFDQYGEKISFPDSYQGKVMLVGYVYTHCPDICPLITYNMRDIQDEFKGREELMMVSISFDPERDSPEILYDYANNYRLDQSNWRLLTGDRKVIDQALNDLEIRTLKTPTRFTDDGRPQYFIDHTDKVTLIDRSGNIRNTYPGSEMNTEEIVDDIHTLLMEN
ncbi:SCO family protein [Rhodohalobacter sp. SW132]|nr:SCO family protein [Rhodohalobacter sp. SW132]